MKARRLLSCMYSRGGAAVKVDASAFSGRLDLLERLLRALREALYSLGASEVSARAEGDFYVLFARGLPSMRYGELQQRCLELEAELKRRFEAQVRHAATLLISSEALPEFKLAVYRLTETPISKVEGYRLLSQACSFIEAQFSVVCDRLSYAELGVPLAAGEVPVELMEVEVADRTFLLKLVGVHQVDFKKRLYREFAKRLVNRALRSQLRSCGFRVRGLSAYRVQPLWSTEVMAAYPGVEFQTMVLDDGSVLVGLSPRHEVSSLIDLWRLFGGERRLFLKAADRVVDSRVRKNYAEPVYMVSAVRDLCMDSPIAEAGGRTLLQLYAERGVDVSSISSDEPVVVLRRGVRCSFDAPSMLTKIYTAAEIAKLPNGKELLRMLHVPPQRWSSYLSEYLDCFMEVDLGFHTIKFSEFFPEVELL